MARISSNPILFLHQSKQNKEIFKSHLKPKTKKEPALEKKNTKTHKKK